MSSPPRPRSVEEELRRTQRRLDVLERLMMSFRTNDLTDVAGVGFDDYVYLYIDTPDPTITGDGNQIIDWDGDVYEVGSGDLLWPYAADNESVGPLEPGRLYLATASVETTGQAVGDLARISLQTSPSGALLGGDPGNEARKESTNVVPKASVSMFVMVSQTAALKVNVTVEVASGATVTTLRELTFSVARFA